MKKILVTGAGGQLGSELCESLASRFGEASLLATDIRQLELPYPFLELDVTDGGRLQEVIEEYSITEVYHLAAVLSAKGEERPREAWDINMGSLVNVLEAARKYNLKVYWPSSIAVFGPGTPKTETPQNTVMDPSTIYGISKLAGERWCEYYYQKFGVDVRSLRYPGLIGYKAKPGGGTTDYAVDIFWKAVKGEVFTCFLQKDTVLPMMYMDDAVRATIDLMESPAAQIKVRSSYNITAMSFSPEDLFISIKKHLPDFEIEYSPDFRQEIAASWPSSIDDSNARIDWEWEAAFDLPKMTAHILMHLKESAIA